MAIIVPIDLKESRKSFIQIFTHPGDEVFIRPSNEINNYRHIGNLTIADWCDILSAKHWHLERFNEYLYITAEPIQC